VMTSESTLIIDLLALDLNACKRCSGTDANLRSALEALAPLLREVGVEVAVRRTIVASADQAERLRFESSPTIRIDGRDIADEVREGPCGDCGELCGCSGGVACRVWVWRGREYPEAPTAMILDAVLKAYARPGRPADATSQPFRLPENLRRYFAAPGECCDVSACCEPADKAGCCAAPPRNSVSGCQ
jgi:hypothetical protein